MSKENPLWGAPRIHGELLKLGFELAESTVSKYMIRRRLGGHSCATMIFRKDRGFDSQKHPRRLLWSVGMASAWVEDLIYNSIRLSQ